MAKATKTTKKAAAKVERRGRPAGVGNFRPQDPIVVRDYLKNAKGEEIGIRVYCNAENHDALVALSNKIQKQDPALFKLLGISTKKATKKATVEPQPA